MSKTDDLKTDLPPSAGKTRLLTPSGPHTLPSGSVLVVCATPGFRRAGITHERVKIWSRRDLSPDQITIMKHEPELTVIEVA